MIVGWERQKSSVIHVRWILTIHVLGFPQPEPKPGHNSSVNHLISAQVPNIKCFDPDKTWAFFMTALRELENRFDASQLHITGYSMGGWMQILIFCVFGLG